MEVEMFRRVYLVLAMCLIITCMLNSEDRVQAELRFTPASSAEKNAGVWVDGNYLGYIRELNGNGKVMLLPGMHQIVARQAWYQDYVEELLVEPGKVYNLKLAMTKAAQTPNKSAAAEVKISATPNRSAVFVDGQFAGHCDEFDGVGRAMLLTPGQHKLTVALPGYLPFETVLNVRAHQKLKIQTTLAKGSITDAGSLVSPRAAP
jgi:hypothetical protein